MTRFSWALACPIIVSGCWALPVSEGTLTVEGRLSQPGSECSVLLENQAKPVVPDRDGKFQALFVVMSKPYQYQVEVLCEEEEVFSGVADYPPGSLDVGEVGGRT